MQYVLVFLFCSVLALIIYHDFKSRALPIYTLAIALLFSILLSLSKNGLQEALSYAGMNVLLISLQLGLTTLYFSIRRKKMIHLFNTYLGLGDVLFFLVTVFCFSPLNLMVFMILSGLIILLVYLPLNKGALIPLAGCLSIFLGIILVLSHVVEIIDPYNDYFLMDLFHN
jgi:hypothetical protein